MARAFALGASLLALAACGPNAEAPEGETAEIEETGPVEVLVTAAFTAVEGGGGPVGFLPDPNAPSLGFVLSAPGAGGIDIFDLDGLLKTRHAGERLTGLAVAPAFELRGEALPLIFGSVSDANAVRGYAVVRDGAQVLDLPLGAIEPVDGVAGLCLMREGVGFVELVILGTGAHAEIWRVRDAGSDQLSVERVRDFPLPAPARQCATLDGDIYTASPVGGIARLSGDGTILAEDPFRAANLTLGDFNGTQRVLATSGSGETVESFDAETLVRGASLDIVDGLSTPGIQTPAALAVTDADFGYTAYANGLMVVFDEGAGRLKVVSRDALIRAVVAQD
ncbi:hypothetical protein [Maricaulis maris]|uniref:BPP domain-containing protein n=1 Tax=Maricaulis maris TaxID=74318 RepID=A0A495DKQ1_9PROT|nr:hypothetical protein [Maricaulis maris]RKR02867.1 hypothetical protein C7435_0810 [Maricaulis maris]